jgi:hypothetical protein
MSEDAGTLANSIEHFYKAHLEPAGERVNDFWNLDIRARQPVRGDWQKSEKFFDVIDGYMFRDYTRSLIKVNQWFDRDNRNVGLLCENFADLLNNYFARL